MTNIGCSESLNTTLVGKVQNDQNYGYSESFQTTLVGKDGKKCEMLKIVNAKSEHAQ